MKIQLESPSEQSVELQRYRRADLAATLRACLSAQRTSSRRFLLNQAEQSLGLPLESDDDSREGEPTVDRETLRAVLDDLERVGDVTVGSGGKVAVAPLRFVQTGEGRGLLIGTAPTRNLRRLGLSEEHFAFEAGIPRRFSVEAADVPLAELLEKAEGLGARVLSVETWARLDETAPAEASFLRSLEERAEREGEFLESPGKLFGEDPVWCAIPERDADSYGICGWEKLTDDGAHLDVDDVPAGLLRRLAFGRYYAFHWVARGEGSQSEPRLLRLSRSESTRAQYALLRDAGAEMPVLAVNRRDGQAVLSLEVFLPAEEYRFLTGMAQKSDSEGGTARFEIPSEGLERVLEVLEARLGLVTKEIRNEES